MPKFFATCARGLEPLLAKELAAINALDIKKDRGGVNFSGDSTTLYNANLWLRTAVRVLQPLFSYICPTPDDLYEACRTVKWFDLMTTDHTLAVDCNVRDSGITHSQYAARRGHESSGQRLSTYHCLSSADVRLRNFALRNVLNIEQQLSSR